MFNPIRFVCLGGAALTLSACSVPDFEYSDLLGLQSAQQAAAPAAAPNAKPVRVAAPAPAAVPEPVAQQQVADEVEQVGPTNRWAHQRIGNTPYLDDGDETRGWGG